MKLPKKYRGPRLLKFVPLKTITNELELRGIECLMLDSEVDEPALGLTSAEKQCEKNGHTEPDSSGLCTWCKQPVNWPAHTPDLAGWNENAQGEYTDD